MTETLSRIKQKITAPDNLNCNIEWQLADNAPVLRDKLIMRFFMALRLDNITNE